MSYSEKAEKANAVVVQSKPRAWKDIIMELNAVLTEASTALTEIVGPMTKDGEERKEPSCQAERMTEDLLGTLYAAKVINEQARAILERF